MAITHIKNFNLWRYIVGYTVGNQVLCLRWRVAVKLNFRPYIRQYISLNENFEYSNPLIDINVIAEMADYPAITSVAEGHTDGETNNVRQYTQK